VGKDEGAVPRNRQARPGAPRQKARPPCWRRRGQWRAPLSDSCRLPRTGVRSGGSREHRQAREGRDQLAAQGEALGRCRARRRPEQVIRPATCRRRWRRRLGLASRSSPSSTSALSQASRSWASRHELEPRLVALERLEGQSPEPELGGLLDAVLDPRVEAVAPPRPVPRGDRRPRWRPRFPAARRPPAPRPFSPASSRAGGSRSRPCGGGRALLFGVALADGRRSRARSRPGARRPPRRAPARARRSNRRSSPPSACSRLEAVKCEATSPNRSGRSASAPSSSPQSPPSISIVARSQITRPGTCSGGRRWSRDSPAERQSARSRRAANSGTSAVPERDTKSVAFASTKAIRDPCDASSQGASSWLVMQVFDNPHRPCSGGHSVSAEALHPQGS
jgi:hypothetical protein